MCVMDSAMRFNEIRGGIYHPSGRSFVASIWVSSKPASNPVISCKELNHSNARDCSGVKVIAEFATKICSLSGKKSI